MRGKPRIGVVGCHHLVVVGISTARWRSYGRGWAAAPPHSPLVTDRSRSTAYPASGIALGGRATLRWRPSSRSLSRASWPSWWEPKELFFFTIVEEFFLIFCLLFRHCTLNQGNERPEKPKDQRQLRFVLVGNVGPLGNTRTPGTYPSSESHPSLLADQ